MYDLVIVGGGIVGLATARETATRHPNMRIALVEKEKQLGMCMSTCMKTCMYNDHLQCADGLALYCMSSLLGFA